MNIFILALFGLMCTFVLINSIKKTAGVYSYSFLASTVFIGFVGIQLIGVANNEYIPEGAFAKTVIMALLCILMVYLGAIFGGHPYKALKWNFNERRLVQASLVLSVIGSIFYFLVSRLPEETRQESMPSGIMVALFFFGQMMKYGFAIAALVYASRPSKLCLLIIVYDLLVYADRMLFAARRGEIAVVIVILVMAFWFKRGFLLSRKLVIGMIVLSTIFIYSTGDYRQNTEQRNAIDSLMDVSYFDNLENILKYGGVELELAAYQIEAADRRNTFNFGAYYWNILVFNYVPAQLFGEDFKDFVTFQLENSSFLEFGFEGLTGSTTTGLVDAFQAFWYFGAILFFIISYILNRLYSSAIQGNTSMQLIYMLMLINGLISITHNVGWFLSPWVHLAIFLMPALYYARVRFI